MPQIFKSNPTYSLGVELELQLVDSQTGALANCIGQVLDRVPPQWKDSIKPEFMQSYCEINTGVCASVAEVESDLTEKLLWALKRKVTNLELVPSDGGRFEVSVDGKPIYSKLDTGQFPDEEKIVAEITKRAA